MTVKQLLASLDSAELTEWLAYWRIENEPSPPTRDPIDPEVLKKAFGA